MHSLSSLPQAARDPVAMSRTRAGRGILRPSALPLERPVSCPASSGQH